MSERPEMAGLEQVLGWVDEEFGPIKRLWGKCLRPPEPRWWVYACELCRAPFGTWHSAMHFGAAGSSIEPKEALCRALGESVERYCGLNAITCAERTVLPFNEGDLAASLPLCAPTESAPQEFKAPLSKKKVTHVSMTRLDSGQTVLVPAEYVHLGFTPREPEPRVTIPISTGLSFHPNRRTALWRGLCEVAERDAMMIMWWTCRKVQEILFTGRDLPENLRTRLERLRHSHIAPFLFDITSDFRIPTVFCILKSSTFPYFVTGACCHENAAIACAKAIDECVSVRLSLQWKRWQRAIPSYSSFEWVKRLEDHMALYAAWHDTRAFDFLFFTENHGVPYEDFANSFYWPAPSDTREMAQFAGDLVKKGWTVLFAELTLPEAAGIGYVVKVVIPQMVPLSQDHNARWLATARLSDASYTAHGKTSQWNPFPHPFA